MKLKRIKRWSFRQPFSDIMMTSLRKKANFQVQFRNFTNLTKYKNDENIVTILRKQLILWGIMSFEHTGYNIVPF